MNVTRIPWQARARKSIGFRLSRLGQALGIHALTYNPFIMLEFHEHGLREAPKVADAFKAVFPTVQRIFDVGCGSGAFAAEFSRRGYSVTAVEHSNYGRTIAARQGVKCRSFDLTQLTLTEVSEDFDLAYCFEVAEHLPPLLGRRLVEFLAGMRTTVVFTAAHPGQGGIGHINEQPKGYWIEEFRRHRAGFDAGASLRLSNAFKQSGAAFWFVDNVMVFVPNV